MGARQTDAAAGPPPLPPPAPAPGWKLRFGCCARPCTGRGAEAVAAPAPWLSTPLLALDAWVLCAAVFLVGLAAGDRLWLFSVVVKDNAALAVMFEGFQYVGPFCWATNPTSTALLSSTVLGYGVGALLAVLCASRFGRRRTLWAGMGVYALARLLQLTMFGLVQFFFAEHLLCLACGALLLVTIVDAVEVAPAERRGTLVAALHFGETVGTFCGSLLSLGLAHASFARVEWVWRLVPAYALWIVGVLLVLLVWLPETPASLVQKGQIAEARYALQQLRGCLTSVDREFRQILDATETTTRVASQASALASQRDCWVALLLALLLTTLNMLCGEVAVLHTMKFAFQELFFDKSQAWSPWFIDREVRRSGFISDIICLVLQGASMVVGALLALGLADRVSRRCALSGCSAFASLFYGATAAIIGSIGKSGQLPRDAAWAATATLSAALVFLSATLAFTYIFVFEVQPLPSRFLSISLVLAVHSALSFAWFMISLPWMCEWGAWGLYAFSSASAACSSVIAWLLLLDTRGCPLEVISSLWSRHWVWRHVVVPPARSAAKAALAQPRGMV